MCRRSSPSCVRSYVSTSVLDSAQTRANHHVPTDPHTITSQRPPLHNTSANLGTAANGPASTVIPWRSVPPHATEIGVHSPLGQTNAGNACASQRELT
jgi:hypothetical protein